MGYDDAWAAFHGELPARIPRTEYSTGGHFALQAAVTGIPVTRESDGDTRRRARQAFERAWDFGFQWGTDIGAGHIGGRRTDMGHAVYADGGTDWRDTVGCPFETVEEVLAYDPAMEAGHHDHADLVRFFDERWRGRCAACPDQVCTTGTYVTLFSGLIDIFGWEMLLMAAGMDPDGFGAVAERYAAWMRPVYEALAESAAPVVMVHDDICWTAGPPIAPAWFRRYVFPQYHAYFAPLKEAGKRILFTSDGDYTVFFDDIVAAGAHGLVMEPCCDMAGFAARYGRTHAFIGNADTRILLADDPAAIDAEVERCVAIGHDCPGFVMAVGNHIPANTPVAAAQRYQARFEALRRR